MLLNFVRDATELLDLPYNASYSLTSALDLRSPNRAVSIKQKKFRYDKSNEAFLNTPKFNF